jgi:glycosyltransferase involved in cell wall biosynthesis
MTFFRKPVSTFRDHALGPSIEGRMREASADRPPGSARPDDPDPGIDGRGDVRLLVPVRDVADPEVTILIPALDEERTIGQFIDWCRQGIGGAGASAEILIVDSSTDRTAEIALARGARVLATPRHGLGRAYIDAVVHVRGRFVIMGDADCTYDFRNIKPYVDAYRAGAEFVMGSRFKGKIAPGAMPGLHRYFGTPLTTFILNAMFGSKFSDIHCGMRGLTQDALTRMDLRSQGWEYASEMVLKSVHMRLVTVEVPIDFLASPPGRLSHMKRRGWREPWRAGWMNLRAMLTYGVDFFLLKPGAALLALGLGFLIPLSFGPFALGLAHFSLNTMLLAMAMATLGLSMVFSGLIAGVLFDYSDTLQGRIEHALPFNRTFVGCLIAALAGLLAMLPLVRSYVSHHFSLPDGGIETHWAVTGLWLVSAAFQTFIFAAMIRALGVVLPKRDRNSGRAPS